MPIQACRHVERTTQLERCRRRVQPWEKSRVVAPGNPGLPAFTGSRERARVSVVEAEA